MKCDPGIVILAHSWKMQAANQRETKKMYLAPLPNALPAASNKEGVYKNRCRVTVSPYMKTRNKLSTMPPDNNRRD